MQKLSKQAFYNSLLTAGYIVLIATFMFYAGQAKIGRSNSVLIPITFLLLVVCSAGFTGFLVLGHPAMMYMDGKKKEAVNMLIQTLLFLFIITIAAVALMILLPK